MLEYFITARYLASSYLVITSEREEKKLEMFV